MRSLFAAVVVTVAGLAFAGQPAVVAAPTRPLASDPVQQIALEKKAKKPKPGVSKVKPVSGSTAGGTTVTVTGTNLSGLKKVTVGGRKAKVISKKATKVVIRTPEAAACPKATVNVVVTTKNGASKTSTKTRFTYNGVTVEPTVAAGFLFSVALDSAGRVFTWGEGDLGKLGQGNTTDYLSPRRVSGLGCITAISAGDQHAAVLTAGGAVWSWGDSRSGQVGDGALGTRLRPSRASLAEPVAQISAADAKTVALTRSGKVYGWGRAGSGEFGSTATTLHKEPKLIQFGINVRAVAAGAGNVGVIRTNGTVVSTGLKLGLGAGSGAPEKAPKPFEATGLTGVTDLRFGGTSVNAVGTGGQLFGWGDNNENASGGPARGTGGGSFATPGTASLTNAVAVAGIYPHGLGLTTNGSVFAWGVCSLNNCDPAGVSAAAGARLSPTQVTGVGSGNRAIGAGSNRFLVVAADGSVWQWGVGSMRPGDTNTTTVVSPVKVAALDLTP